MRIGLTGGIASGKSTVARKFEQFGISVISADNIAKTVLEKYSPTLSLLVKEFGEKVLLEDGSLNRTYLREIIFTDTRNRKLLDSITHPIIGKKLVQEAEKANSPYVILEIPLLTETGMSNLVDRVLVIETDLQTQIERVQDRDNCSRLQAESIIQAQASSEDRQKIAHDIIRNNGGIQHLHNCVKILHTKYLDLVEKKIYEDDSQHAEFTYFDNLDLV